MLMLVLEKQRKTSNIEHRTEQSEVSNQKSEIRERAARTKLLKELRTGNAEDAADLPALAPAIQKQASALGIILLEIV
jgi:hypothetical protein